MITAAMMRHGLDAILNPFCIWTVLFTCLLFTLCLHGDSVMLRAGFCILLGALLLFSTAWLPRMMVHKLESQYSVITKINPNIHWVVVFSGGQMINVRAPANHLLSNISIQRLVEGVRLYRQLPKSKLLLSGGCPFGEAESEASRLAVLASWFSIPDEDVVLDSKSINTADEALAIKQWVHQEPFYLVTSAIHLPRAMALCHKQGLNPIAAPSDYPYDQKRGWQKDIAPDATNVVHACVAWHEMLGWIWGMLKREI